MPWGSAARIRRPPAPPWAFIGPTLHVRLGQKQTIAAGIHGENRYVISFAKSFDFPVIENHEFQNHSRRNQRAGLSRHVRPDVYRINAPPPCRFLMDGVPKPQKLSVNKGQHGFPGQAASVSAFSSLPYAQFAKFQPRKGYHFQARCPFSLLSPRSSMPAGVEPRCLNIVNGAPCLAP